MIPDVPRVPSDPALRGQVLDLYRVLAAMRDYIEYQFNVIEDRFRDLESAEADGGTMAVIRIEDELEEIRRQIRKLQKAEEVIVDALSSFDFADWLDDNDMQSAVTSAASSAVSDVESDFAYYALGFTFTSSAVGEIVEGE